MLKRNAIILFLLATASLLLGTAANLFFVNRDSSDKMATRISRNLAKEIAAIESEANQLISSNDELVWRGAAHSFFMMDSVQLLRWNRNEFLPDVRLLQADFEIRLFQSSRGSFILNRWTKGGNVTIVSVLPLVEKYTISNRYLTPTWNHEIFGSSSPAVLDPLSAEGYSIAFSGEPLFKVEFPEEALAHDSTGNAIILISGWFALLLFAGSLCLIIIDLHRKKKFGLAFFTLLTGVILIRVIMINFDFPRDYSTLFIFDPLQFASSDLNPSIADLFFNTVAVFVIAVYFFYTYYRWPVVRKINRAGNVVRLSLSIVCLLICFYAILFSFFFFETISHNSNISLDVSQTINFDLIRTLAFLSIILGSVAVFLFGHIFFKLALVFVRHSKVRFYITLTVSALAFFLIYKISEKDYVITLLTGLVYFLLLFQLDLSSSLRRFSYATFLYFFLAIMMLAAQGSLSIKRFVEEKTREDQFKYGSNFLVERDILGEYLLNEAIRNISADPFIQSRMGTPFFAKSGVRQKISQVYLNAYFDRYEVHIYLYNASGESHDDLAKVNFATLIRAFQQEANKTTYEGVYFIESASQEAAKRYIAVIPIDQHGPAGYVVLDLSLKKLIPQNVFPELLVDNQFINYFKSSDFSYAFFLNGILISNSGSYNYERNFDTSWLENNNLHKLGVQGGGFTHIAIEAELGRVAVVSAPDYPSFYILSNFSFLFVLGLCVVLFLLILYAVVLWINGERLNYAARIQVYVYLAFLLPLIAVSITTLNLISRSEEAELQSEFLGKSRIIGERLGGELEKYLQAGQEAKSEFESQLLNVARLANLDASVFSVEGKLIASSQPLIYQNLLVSTLIDREAWNRVVTEKETSFVKNDGIGNLAFNTSYSALKSPDTGALIGILGIPFFDSVHSLEKTQISVWLNILVIFVIVFLLFSLVSFFIVNWLTFPLRFITRTLGKTTFSGENKPLAWKSNDEIGLMVSEYNRMLENLELSKVELARSQKESAWREIAKQIAHEINNPLTPMKLTLQRMELAQLKGELSKEDTTKSLKTLLSQVDILNEIASSFSTFARMPSPVLRNMDISVVLKKVVDLHAMTDRVVIQLSSLEPTMILGDDQLLTRILSNVVLNAMQSVEEGRKVGIKITAKTEGSFCLVSITDNGNGIADDLKEKVFLPHFSTKKTGSGIGLAIAKQGIELSGGEIWFESEVGVGTAFYIRLPLNS